MIPQDKAKAYARERHILFFLGVALTFAFLTIYQFILSGFCKNFSFSLHANIYIATTVYVVLFLFIRYLFNLPLTFYGSYVLEHKFALSNQTLGDWIKDEVKSNLISLVVFIFLVNVFYLMLRKSGPLWWIWLALCWMLFTVVFTRIMPTLIIPLFYKYKPLSNANLKDRIQALAKKSAIKLMDVFQIDFSKKTKKANAAVVGIGKSRRVILTDTLLENFSEDEIGTVCAHEFAHHKLLHILKIITFSSILTAIGFYILSLTMQKIALTFAAEAIYDIGIFPSFMIVFFVFSLFIMAIQNAYSRMLEKEADIFAIDVTSNTKAFISVMEKLAKLNLADVDPPKLIKYIFYNHPPISERIKMANEKGTSLHRH